MEQKYIKNTHFCFGFSSLPTSLNLPYREKRKTKMEKRKKAINSCVQVYFTLVSMRIRIQIQGFDDQKLEREKLYSFDQQLQFTYS